MSKLYLEGSLLMKELGRRKQLIISIQLNMYTQRFNRILIKYYLFWKRYYSRL